MESGKVVGKASGSKSFSSISGGDGLIFNCNAAAVYMQLPDPQQFRKLLPEKGVTASGPSRNSFVIQGRPETTAIYADGRLFTRTFDGILCYDLRTKP